MGEPFTISVAALQQALAPAPVPAAVFYQEPGAPFRVELLLGSWQISDSQSPVRITIASGVLHDTDKGPFVLDGIQLSVSLSPAAGVEPLEVLNPGVLSELQQAGLLDAVATTLTNSGAGGFQVVDVDAGQTTGLLAHHADGLHATLILENRGQPPAPIIQTSAGIFRVTDPPKNSQPELIVLTGDLPSQE